MLKEKKRKKEKKGKKEEKRKKRRKKKIQKKRMIRMHGSTQTQLQSGVEDGGTPIEIVAEIVLS